MAEYIEQEASLAILRKNPTGTWRGVPVYSDDIKAAIHEVENLPAEDVSSVVHGRWVLESDDDQDEGHYYCSICKSAEYFADFVPFSKFCSNCGAKMQEAR